RRFERRIPFWIHPPIVTRHREWLGAQHIARHALGLRLAARTAGRGISFADQESGHRLSLLDAQESERGHHPLAMLEQLYDLRRLEFLPNLLERGKRSSRVARPVESVAHGTDLAIDQWPAG